MNFDPQDTPEQRRTLRSSKVARRTRGRFPAGTRVRARHASTEELGTVRRHVPATDSQGGYLVVRWDRTGHEGRVGPITVEPLSAP